MKILIFGLPGSGKTYLAKKLMDHFGTDRAEWLNADAIRKECDDWDFSEAGRERQLNQMLEKPTMFVDYVITQKRGDIDIQAIVAQLEKGIAR